LINLKKVDFSIAWNKNASPYSNSPLPRIPMVYRGGDPHHEYPLLIYGKSEKMSTTNKHKAGPVDQSRQSKAVEILE